MIKKKCKICRRLNQSVCGREKCAFLKRPYAPGMLDSARKHRKSFSEYSLQLREKQKARYTYNLSEKQFYSYVKKALSTQGSDTKEQLFLSLESRLDNVVFRLGLAKTRSTARQIVSHGHIIVNGRRVNIPSYRVKVGDVLGVRDGSKKKTQFMNVPALLESSTVTAPSWIKPEFKSLSCTINGIPKLDEESSVFNLTSVLEYYSR